MEVGPLCSPVNEPFRPPRDHIDAGVDSQEPLLVRILRLVLAVIEVVFGAITIVGGFLDPDMGTGVRIFVMALSTVAFIVPGILLAAGVKGRWWIQLLPLAAVVVFLLLLLFAAR